MIVKIVKTKDIFSPLNPKAKLSAEAGILLSEIMEPTITDEDQIRRLILNSASGERRFQELLQGMKAGVIPTVEQFFTQIGFAGDSLNPKQKENLRSIVTRFLAGFIQELEDEKRKLDNSILNLKQLAFR